jgi:hypothetical protein
MTNGQINIAIAEACGWKQITLDNKPEEIWEHANPPYQCKAESKLPNCAGCLNAMHEAEKEMKPSDLTSYLEMLFDWLEADCIRASASTRAEAFLRTLGKWEEEV